MSARDALTAKIKFKREHKDRLQVKLNAVTSEIADLIAQRDALTDGEASKVDDLARVGVVRVND